MTLDEEVDQLLAQFSVAEVILAAEAATLGLKRAAQSSAFKLVSVNKALDAFDLGREPPLGTLPLAQFRELEQHLNAFALRTRLDLIAAAQGKGSPHELERTPCEISQIDPPPGQPFGKLSRAQSREIEKHLRVFALRTDLFDLRGRLEVVEAPRGRGAPSKKESAPREISPINPPHAVSPDEVLAQTTLRTIILMSAGGVSLRARLKKWLSSDLFDMTALSFLADDDGEARFREALDTRGFLDLCELVNAFAWVTHHGGADG